MICIWISSLHWHLNSKGRKAFSLKILMMIMWRTLLKHICILFWWNVLIFHCNAVLCYHFKVLFTSYRWPPGDKHPVQSIQPLMTPQCCIHLLRWRFRPEKFTWTFFAADHKESVFRIVSFSPHEMESVPRMRWKRVENISGHLHCLGF